MKTLDTGVPVGATHICSLSKDHYRIMEWCTNTELFVWGNGKWLPVPESIHVEVIPYLVDLEG